MLIFVEGIRNYCPPLKEVDVNVRDTHVLRNDSLVFHNFMLCPSPFSK